jgi:hypothetical protein
MASSDKPELPPVPEAAPQVSVQWDDSQMESVYANIGTATANREEFFMLYGTHKNWRGVQGDGGEVEVQLSKRMVMSPFAAKRMSLLLQQAIQAYETQFGKIDI